MTRRVLLATVLMLASLSVAPAFAQVTPRTIPVAGTLAQGGTFNGTLSVTRFVAQGGVTYAVGSLTGTLTDALGGVIGSVTNLAVNLPLTSTAGTACNILHLVLGPIDLNLLGLVVHLNQVVLDITAQPGAGNLLGNLLCTVAGLLDNSNASLNAITGLLNRILGLLG